MQTSPDQDRWILARGERDGFPMIIRMAGAYRGLGGLPGYDHHLIVGVNLREPTPAGFPSRGEGDDLERFELNLASALELDDESRCVLVITNRGVRDFIFYTRSPEGAKAKIDAARPALKGFEFHIALEPDKDWIIYQAFDKSLAQSSRPN